MHVAHPTDDCPILVHRGGTNMKSSKLVETVPEIIMLKYMPALYVHCLYSP